MTNATTSGRDELLVDEVSEALHDPALTTDRRIRLQSEIHDVLRKAHVDVHGDAGHEMHEQLNREHEQVEKILEAVLVDPEVHTALRMRLLHEIPKLTRKAYAERGITVDDL